MLWGPAPEHPEPRPAGLLRHGLRPVGVVHRHTGRHRAGREVRPDPGGCAGGKRRVFGGRVGDGSNLSTKHTPRYKRQGAVQFMLYADIGHGGTTQERKGTAAAARRCSQTSMSCPGTAAQQKSRTAKRHGRSSCCPPLLAVFSAQLDLPGKPNSASQSSSTAAAPTASASVATRRSDSPGGLGAQRWSERLPQFNPRKCAAEPGGRRGSESRNSIAAAQPHCQSAKGCQKG